MQFQSSSHDGRQPLHRANPDNCPDLETPAQHPASPTDRTQNSGNLTGLGTIVPSLERGNG
ncbi:MAG: hypothetical protein SWY16_24825 [Cyanobacteriota bacterium]|nr:hypothetical protein [Cyanobacteriota bacterium]